MISAAKRTRRTRSPPDPSMLDTYAARGGECAYGNLKMIARVVSAVYEDALRPVDLRAPQLSLMWAILATEPVSLSRLGRVSLTDQTTLSRTVENLRRAGFVTVSAGTDGRRKMVALSAEGRARFARAMPHWENAQRRIERYLAVPEMTALAGRVRKSARAAS